MSHSLDRRFEGGCRDLFCGRSCGLDDLAWMKTMPFGLGKEENEQDENDGEHANVEPPEVSPADVIGHGSGDNWADLFESD
jgi:hypothetical protein